MSQESPSRPRSVLSPDEEFVLSLIREVVMGMRARGQVAEIGRVELAIVNAGAQIERIAPGIDAKAYRIRSARFLVQASAGRKAGIELMFIEVES